MSANAYDALGVDFDAEGNIVKTTDTEHMIWLRHDVVTFMAAWMEHHNPWDG
jgi:hypothetical protein